ncbi:MAG: AMP-binding protein [Candidatus Lokiarchaeota archaeon]|nr:AMP-binding protein [Candidatus Lokiarchaeota archaeon]
MSQTHRFKIPDDRPFYGKFWPKGLPKELDIDYSMSLGQLFDDSAEKYSEDPAIWFLNTWMTYKELKRHVDAFTSYLHKIGVQKGDSVAIDLPNCFQFVIAFYSIMKLGAKCIPLNPLYKKHELLPILKSTETKVIITLDVLWAKVISLVEPDWIFNKIIYTGMLDLATGISKLAQFFAKRVLKKVPTAKVTDPRAIDFRECLKTPIDYPNVEIDSNHDIAVISNTGGTTGMPKMVILSHRNLISNAFQLGYLFLKQKPEGEEKFILGHRTGFIAILPLFHLYGLGAVMNMAVAIGGYQVLFPRPPAPEEFLKTIYNLPNYNRFVHYTIEYMLIQFLEVDPKFVKRYPLNGRIAICGYGGGYLHPYVRDRFEEMTGARITEGYGLTEAAPMVSANNLYGHREPGYVGTPGPSIDWDIFDMEDFSNGPVAIGERGEICVTGPNVMLGYWKDPETTAKVLREYEGRTWLLTGDIGIMDEHGRVKIMDRKKQILKIAGRLVFPTEIENEIGYHPLVKEVAVASIPDERTGEAAKAWVVVKEEGKDTLTPEKLRTWLTDNLAHFKVPKFIEFIEEIPKTSAGKVSHRTLQENDPLWRNKQYSQQISETN